MPEPLSGRNTQTVGNAPSEQMKEWSLLPAPLERMKPGVKPEA